MATGPTSTQGRQKVSGNAVKHGLRAQKWLTAEEQADYAALTKELIAEYIPATATEWLMVERIAMGMTKLRRLQAVEDAMYAKARWETANPIIPRNRGMAPELAEASSMPPIKVLDTLARYQTSIDRQVSKALGELLMLKDRARPALADTTTLIANETSPPNKTA